jgi:UDP-3-O-[3-hydroxymyristoyl] N-acetylglucosamine deacetylase/UDP-3-O-[3-hydroxymyristoyl] N-acetylglucosamine deacetylase/3-hydroxyacyl-[acyl-carrier-protein] dehydratase
VNRERYQRTISQSCFVTGRGYWTGQEVTLRFLPAPVDYGHVFVRTDLPGRPAIPAAIAHQHDVELRTVLRTEEASVEMVEHVLAALAGLSIDNCTIEISGSEAPGFDGSALPISNALRSAGTAIQAVPRNQLVIDRHLRIGTAANWVEAIPTLDGRFTVEYWLDYGSQSPIRPQSFRLSITPDAFHEQLAGARTFVTESQVASLREKGLGTHVRADELLVFGDDGRVSSALRWDDECSRHKALDMVGDFSLIGCSIVGKIVSYRGGHRLNASLTRELYKRIRTEQWGQRVA